MTAKGVMRGNLHDLCIGGLLVCLTLLAGGRTAMLPARGGDRLAERGAQADYERISIPFFATRNAGARAASQTPAEDAATKGFSFYLQLHETRDFSSRPVPPSVHECRG